MDQKEKYREFCKKEGDKLSIFAKDWWLDSVCGTENWDVAVVQKGGEIFAAMPYMVREGRLNLKFIEHPKLTQAIGIYLNYQPGQKYYKRLSFEKDMVEQILEQLPRYDRFMHTFHYTFTNMLPFYWRGFSLSVNYSYVIDDISIDELERSFTDRRRKQIKKALKSGVVVEESSDIEEFYRLNSLTFKRQGREIPYSLEFIKRLYSSCSLHNAVKILRAKDSSGETIAASFLVYDASSIYYLMGGIDPNKKDLGGMDLVQLEGIKFALRSGRVFDFEGSMIESIEHYFRSFGAKQKPYYSVTKTDSKLLKIKDFIRELL